MCVVQLVTSLDGSMQHCSPHLTYHSPCSLASARRSVNCQRILRSSLVGIPLRKLRKHELHCPSLTWVVPHVVIVEFVTTCISLEHILIHVLCECGCAWGGGGGWWGDGVKGWGYSCGNVTIRVPKRTHTDTLTHTQTTWHTHIPGDGCGCCLPEDAVVAALKQEGAGV